MIPDDGARDTRLDELEDKLDKLAQLVAQLESHVAELLIRTQQPMPADQDAADQSGDEP
jgi:hypothetical protein